MTPPRQLAVSKLSPHYNKEALALIDKVFVGGVHLPNCVAYNMDEGWAFAKDLTTKAWLPRQFGVVTVTLK